MLIIVSGLSGTGKSTVAAFLAEELNAVHLRTDDLRKKLHARTIVHGQDDAYELMFKEARGFLPKTPVVLDATFARKRHRELARALASELHVPFKVIYTVCPEKLVKKRLEGRQGDPSAATFSAYLEQKSSFDPMGGDVTVIETAKDITVQLKDFMKSKDLIIGLDFDGVVVDHVQNKIRAARQLGIELAQRDTPLDVLANKLEPDTLAKLRHIIYDNRDYALAAPLVKGAKEGLEQLKNAGRNYFLISTQKAPQIVLESLKIRKLWGTYFSEKNVYFVEDANGKNKKVAELSISIYLDDEPSVLALMPSVPHRFLLDSLNVYPEDPNYTKVSSWTEFVDNVLAL